MLLKMFTLHKRAMGSILLTMCLAAFTFSMGKASHVQFEAVPLQLKANLSEDLSMRCSVSDGSDVTSAGSVSADVHQVISIYVTYKDDVDVASVTSTDAPMSYVDLGNLESKGSISATSGEGFLQMRWSDPSKAWKGEYTCTVAAIDGRGHIVQLTSQLTLTEVAPSLDDFVGFFNSKIQIQNKRIEDQNQVIGKQKKDNIAQNQAISLLEQKTVNQTQAIANLEQENAKLKSCVLQKVAFTVALNGTGDLPQQTQGQTVKFDQVILNEGGDYNASTGLFKCEIAGLYKFSIHVMGQTRSNCYACVTLQHNDVRISSARTDTPGIDSASTSAVLSLQTGDTVGAYNTCNSLMYQDYRTNLFTGLLVSPQTCG